MEEIEEVTIAPKKPTYEEEMKMHLEESINYQLQVRREQGIDPKPVIIGFTHIYNTYNSAEREHWQKTGYAQNRAFWLK